VSQKEPEDVAQKIEHFLEYVCGNREDAHSDSQRRIVKEVDERARFGYPNDVVLAVQSKAWMTLVEVRCGTTFPKVARSSS